MDRQELKFRASTTLGKNKLNFGIKTSFGGSDSYNNAIHTSSNSQGQEHTLFHSSFRNIPTVSGDIKFTFERTRKRFAYITYNYADNRTEYTNLTNLTNVSPADETLASSRESIRENYSKVHTAQTFDMLTLGRGHSLTIRSLYTNRQYDDLTQYTYYYYSPDPDDPNEPSVEEIEESGGVQYNQQVVSLSGAYSYRIRNIAAAATLGGQYEGNRGLFRNTNTPLQHSHWQFAPSLSLTWRAKKYFFRTGYSMGTIRPNMNMLNPYEDDSDPKNIYRGNPDLRPETRHSTSLSLSRRFGKLGGSIEMSLSFSLIPNAIERVTMATDNGATLTTYRNIGQRKQYRIGFDNGVIPFSKNVALQYFVGYSFIVFDSPDPNLGHNRTGGFDCIAVLSGRAWSSGTLRLTYNLLSSHNLSQSQKTGYLHNFTFRLDQSIIKNKISASLTVANPFESRSTLREEIAGSNFRTISTREHLGRIVGVSLRFNFGRLKDRVAEAENVP
ncbi:MAG: TonB-dependent receptor, partial [Bacteroidales bacterium]